MNRKLLVRVTFALALGAIALGPAQPAGSEPPALQWFFEATSRDEREARRALERIAAVWRDGYSAMIVDLARLMRPNRRPGTQESPAEVEAIDPEGPPARAPGQNPDLDRFPPRAQGSPIRSRLMSFLERQTGKTFGDDLDRWREWMWGLPYEPHPAYGAFKGAVYANIDPRMVAFFPPEVQTAVRLDEIDWGGVKVNGIPPLVNPKHVPAREASYLKDRHIVFGLVVNGEARAYPKRILAWHEMARDQLGGVPLTIVYCTLCGTVIPYESATGGRSFSFGTSGLLYRSNKLMFDEETMSLWSSLEGKPVVGPLVGSGLQLQFHPSVTATWGEWRAEHPHTTVLSLDTGFERDYSEGAAYREYFSSDRLMFNVSRKDHRLRNKAEVLAFRLRATPVAIAVEFLSKNPVHHLELPSLPRVVVVTSRSGANRVYESASFRFRPVKGERALVDDAGRRWQVTEDALIASDQSQARLARVPAHRAFWFGWYAQFPDTILIK